MRPSCSAFYGTHKFRANCCTGNWFCPWRRPRSIAMAISILQDRQVLPFSPPNPPPPFSMLASSSSLLQFCLNYFACLFMVESLISALVSLATLTTLQRRLQLAGCLAAWLPQLLQLLPHAWPRSRQRARRRIEERALPPYIYDRRQAWPATEPATATATEACASRDRAIQVFRKMDYSCLLSLSGTHAEFLLLLLELTTRMEVFEIGRRDVDQAKQLPYLWLICK